METAFRNDAVVHSTRHEIIPFLVWERSNLSSVILTSGGREELTNSATAPRHAAASERSQKFSVSAKIFFGIFCEILRIV
jgi:hypothetical protein